MPTPIHEETPKQRRLVAAYEQEQQALEAPTGIRNSAPSSFSPAPLPPAGNELSPVEALSRALGARQAGDSSASGQAIENEYHCQNMQ